MFCFFFFFFFWPRSSKDPQLKCLLCLNCRVFWFCLVLTGLSLFSYQVIDRVVYYTSYPVTVNVKINYNTTLRFPAVTVCNQNAFRWQSDEWDHSTSECCFGIFGANTILRWWGVSFKANSTCPYPYRQHIRSLREQIVHVLLGRKTMQCSPN